MLDITTLLTRSLVADGFENASDVATAAVNAWEAWDRGEVDGTRHAVVKAAIRGASPGLYEDWVHGIYVLLHGFAGNRELWARFEEPS